MGNHRQKVPVTKPLSLCNIREAKLSQVESASTQLLSAAVHHLLQERSREDAQGTAMRHQLFAPSRDINKEPRCPGIACCCDLPRSGTAPAA